MRKQYVLLLLLLIGTGVGAWGQDHQVTLSLEGDDTICPGANVMFNVSQQGWNGRFTYTLEFTTDTTATGEDFQAVPGVAPNSASITIPEATGYYRVRLFDTIAYESGNDSIFYSNTVSLVVLPEFNPGTIAGGDTVCYGGVPDTVSIDVAPTNYVGTLGYQWLSSTDSTTWVNIDGATGTTYAPESLIATTWYRLRIVSNCKTDTTAAVKVVVLPELVAPQIGGEGTINVCRNGVLVNPLTLSLLPNGGSGDYIYEWQDSVNGGQWTEISGATENVYLPEATAVDHWYRVKTINAYCNDTVFSNFVQVHVYDTVARPGTPVANEGLICNNGQVTLTATAGSCQELSVAHRWQRRMANGEWNAEEGATDTTYTVTLSNNGTDNDTVWFRLAAFTDSCGDSVFSDAVSVVVLPPFNPGHIRADVSMICYEAQGDTVYFDTLPSGFKGDYQINWYLNNVEHSYHGEVFHMGNLTETTVFEARVENVCATSQSGDQTNTVTINVSDPVTAGSLLMPSAICAGVRPDTLRQAIDAQHNPFHGGIGEFTYQWQIDSVGNDNWTDIDGADSVVYQPDTLYVSRYYRLVGMNVCDTVATSRVMVTVHPQLTAPTIAFVDDTICYGAVPDTLRLDTLATGTENQFKYHWQKTTDDSTWTELTWGINDTLYQPDTLMETTKFRVAVSSNIRGCDTVYSTDTVTIAVLPKLMAGSIVAADNVLCNGLGTTLTFDTADRPTGADGEYGFFWQWSADGSDFEDIAGTDSTGTADSSYTTPVLEETTYYRVRVTNARCLDTVYTNMVEVMVLPTLIVSNIHVEYADTENPVEVGTCMGTVPEGFSLAADTVSATGGSGVYSYYWHTESTDTLSVGTNYSPDTLWTTTVFYMTTTDSLCGSYVSNGITVEVWNLPEERTLGGDTAYLCSGNQPLRYWVVPQEDVTYEWSSPYVTFQNGSDSSMVYLVWNNGYDTVNLTLTLTDTTHGCSRTLVFDSILINTTAQAPDTTDVLIKFGGNILVCKDSTANAHYQWGYTDRATGEDVIYPGSDSRYFQTPDAIDTARRDYFVIVWYNEHCKTRSYYIPHAAAPMPDNDEELNLVVAPNPSFGDVSYILDADIYGVYTVSVFDAVGQLLFTVDASDYTEGDVIRIDRHLHQGIYVVSVATANRVVSQKIIVK